MRNAILAVFSVLALSSCIVVTSAPRVSEGYACDSGYKDVCRDSDWIVQCVAGYGQGGSCQSGCNTQGYSWGTCVSVASDADDYCSCYN